MIKTRDDLEQVMRSKLEREFTDRERQLRTDVMLAHDRGEIESDFESMMTAVEALQAQTRADFFERELPHIVDRVAAELKADGWIVDFLH